MAKGYWIANSDVVDMDGMQKYRIANQGVLRRHGARFVVISGRQRVAEGSSRSRQTIIESPNFDAAIEDPEYQSACKFRHASADGDLVIVEGIEPPAAP